MKKYFLTGLAVLLPLTLTLILLVFVFNILTEPFASIIKNLLSQNHLLEKIPDRLQHIISQIIGLGILFFFTILLGFIGRWLFINYMIKITEKLVQKIPFIRTVYNTCKDVIETLFTTENKSFKQAVLVPYPNFNTYCIGLITRDDMKGLGSKVDEDLIAVFIPCTPNPTSGFLTMFYKKDLIFLEMKVEEAFKYIISCGVISVSFQTTLEPDTSR